MLNKRWRKRIIDTEYINELSWDLVERKAVNVTGWHGSCRFSAHTRS